MKTAGLYIHFPFCVRKCLYCDFLSFPYSHSQHAAYLHSLKNELITRSKQMQDYMITSIFFGGGTPTLMQPEDFESLMQLLHRCYHIESRAEITSEANPGTLSEEKLAAMYSAGINRLSIGLQSAHDQELHSLGRIHTFETFLENYQTARRIGFQNINIDLMSALPRQSVASYINTLQKAAALAPEHISAYSLILEEGTPFFKMQGKLELPSEDDERQMYVQTRSILAANGYAQYEISNYARKGFECRHNLIYWTMGDYLGIGLGAASLIDHQRFHNLQNLEAYQKLWSQPPAECSWHTGTENFEHLNRQAQMEEFMFLGLRLIKGISLNAFQQRFGQPITEVYGDVIQKHLSDGTLIQNGQYLALTPMGLDVSNYVMSDFIL